MNTQSQINLSGRKILVTGAASGIGCAIAKLLVIAGAKVVINDISSEKISDTKQKIGAHGSVVADVSCEKSVKTLIEETSNILDGLDGLVNNAGIFEPIVGTKRQTLDEWRRVIDINLQSIFLISKESANYMETGSSIVNMASVAGITGFSASNAYSVSKAGAIMMTKTMACDLARFGIRVNAVAPGVIEAPMAAKLFKKGALESEVFINRTPLGRLGKQDEVGQAVLFLLSDLASFITGVTLPVDGGWTAFGGAGDASNR